MYNYKPHIRLRGDRREAAKFVKFGMKELHYLRQRMQSPVQIGHSPRRVNAITKPLDNGGSVTIKAFGGVSTVDIYMPPVTPSAPELLKAPRFIIVVMDAKLFADTTEMDSVEEYVAVYDVANDLIVGAVPENGTDNTISTPAPLSECSDWAYSDSVADSMFGNFHNCPLSYENITQWWETGPGNPPILLASDSDSVDFDCIDPDTGQDTTYTNSYNYDNPPFGPYQEYWNFERIGGSELSSNQTMMSAYWENQYIYDGEDKAKGSIVWSDLDGYQLKSGALAPYDYQERTWRFQCHLGTAEYSTYDSRAGYGDGITHSVITSPGVYSDYSINGVFKTVGSAPIPVVQLFAWGMIIYTFDNDTSTYTVPMRNWDIIMGSAELTDPNDFANYDWRGANRNYAFEKTVNDLITYLANQFNYPANDYHMLWRLQDIRIK